MNLLPPIAHVLLLLVHLKACSSSLFDNRQLLVFTTVFLASKQRVLLPAALLQNRFLTQMTVPKGAVPLRVLYKK